MRVEGQKRTIILPDALAMYRPAGASFADGALEVSFDAAGSTQDDAAEDDGR